MAVVATRDGRRRRRAPSRSPPINPIKVPAPSAELARLGAILKGQILRCIDDGRQTVTELAESDPEYEHLIMALEVALRKIHLHHGQIALYMNMYMNGGLENFEVF
ncbi:hypothetical protein B0H19DRAFT_1070908 [Mycena capillaripes]|nr:hypothetical protein B0H19DRAFT_1070908 [Mycena capillaripes]